MVMALRKVFELGRKPMNFLATKENSFVIKKSGGNYKTKGLSISSPKMKERVHKAREASRQLRVESADT